MVLLLFVLSSRGQCRTFDNLDSVSLSHSRCRKSYILQTYTFQSTLFLNWFEFISSSWTVIIRISVSYIWCPFWPGFCSTYFLGGFPKLALQYFPVNLSNLLTSDRSNATLDQPFFIFLVISLYCSLIILRRFSQSICTHTSTTINSLPLFFGPRINS